MSATTVLLRGETPESGLTTRDGDAVGRMVRRVEVTGVELVQADFERHDDPLDPTDISSDDVPNVGLNAEWALHRAEGGMGTLVCVMTFATVFDAEPGPYFIGARLRLTYRVDGPDEVTEHELEQFTHHNAMFNAWPYWREFASSMVNRAQLPRFVVPVMRMPS